MELEEDGEIRTEEMMDLLQALALLALAACVAQDEATGFSESSEMVGETESGVDPDYQVAVLWAG